MQVQEILKAVITRTIPHSQTLMVCPRPARAVSNDALLLSRSLELKYPAPY
jgi:hypothetical protein